MNSDATKLRRKLTGLRDEFVELVDGLNDELDRIYAPAREAEALKWNSPERVRALKRQQEEEAKAACKAAEAKLAPLIKDYGETEKRIADVYRETFEADGDGGREARQDVQRLLDRGLAPASIIERARATKDAATLRALRSELPWLTHTPRLRALGEKLADEGELAGLIEATERSLAELSTGEEGQAMNEALQLATEADVAGRARVLAVKATTGSGASASERMAFGYAQAAGGD